MQRATRTNRYLLVFFSGGSTIINKLRKTYALKFHLLTSEHIDICMTPRSILSSSRWHYSVILDQRKIQCTLKYLQIHRGRTQSESGDPDAKRYQTNANHEESNKKRVFIQMGLRELPFLRENDPAYIRVLLCIWIPPLSALDLFRFDQARARSCSRIPSRLVACTPLYPGPRDYFRRVY